jgi:hypothetical protein
MKSRLDVVTSARTSRTARSSKDSSQNVAEVPKVSKLLTTGEATGHGTKSSNFVVLLTLLGVADDVVGGSYFLELLLRAGVSIGMEFLCQLAIGTGDFLIGRSLRHSEDFVEVLFKPLALCH